MINLLNKTLPLMSGLMLFFFITCPSFALADNGKKEISTENIYLKDGADHKDETTLSKKQSVIKRLKNVSIGLSNRCDQIRKYQNSKDGSKNWCEFNPIFGIQYEVPYFEKFSILIKSDISYPKNSKDNSITKITGNFLIGTNYRPHKINFYYNSMIGIAMTNYRGKGGVQILDNGEGSEEFFNPSLNRYATNVLVNVGAGYDINKLWTSEIYTQIYNLEASKRRSFNIGLGFIYHLGKRL